MTTRHRRTKTSNAWPLNFSSVAKLARGRLPTALRRTLMPPGNSTSGSTARDCRSTAARIPFRGLDRASVG
jgi:hypothetical protein